ncbi:MAG: DegV family protein [Lachnospiraceae bacterium]
MNPKKMIQAIGNHNLTLQERLFRLLAMIGLIGLALSIIAGFVAGENKVNSIVTIAIFVVFCGITYFTLHYHKIQLGTTLIACVIIYFMLPFNFFSTGGIYGGAPIWFLFGVIFICLVVAKKVKYFLIVSSFVICGVCYYVAYYHPELILQHTLEMAYIDSIASLIIVSALTCGMILFQNAIYRSENTLAQKQKKEIEELNQAQNRFFSSMSHEIRTPINTIIGLNEMILREDVSEEVAADAKNIQGASKMLLALINDILDMSKIESGKMDIVPVTYNTGDMLSEIVNMIWVRAREKGLEFHIDVDQTMPAQLLGDEVRIKQILINVLNNAVKYTSEGSVTLSIQCKMMKDDSAQIIYSVTDTGMGIKKESLPYLFSAFKRVDEAKNRYIEGTGLGLSIVKQLVELMDGEIAVNSVYTKGSTFVITIPQKVVGEAEIGELNMEARHALNAKEHYKQSFEAPKAHILIVDDNETNLMVAEKLLRETKVKVDTAASGKECLKKTIQNQYNVIFMDHLMPVMDGIECFHAIRNQTGGLNQGTPVVILTANAGSENQALYRREGFDGYLLKPVTGIQLETELLRHLPKQLITMNQTGESIGVMETPVYKHRKRMPVLISTESVCDLPKSFIEKYQIAVIPYRVVTDDGEFLDGLEAETDGILSYMQEQGKHAYSMPAEPEELEEYFADQLTKARSIVHITMAQNVGKGYENALEASKTFDNVTVVDSGQLSSGTGLMVLCAAQYAVKGMSADAITRELEYEKTRVKTSFIVTSTEYLARAGRISSKIDIFCRAFMIHPVIVLKNSSMKVGSIRMGTREYAWKKYITSALHGVRGINTKTVFITYVGLTIEELQEIEAQVKKEVPFENVIYQKASPSIATNCGPGSFGLLFMLENTYNKETI